EKGARLERHGRPAPEPRNAGPTLGGRHRHAAHVAPRLEGLPGRVHVNLLVRDPVGRALDDGVAPQLDEIVRPTVACRPAERGVGSRSYTAVPGELHESDVSAGPGKLGRQTTGPHPAPLRVRT